MFHLSSFMVCYLPPVPFDAFSFLIGMIKTFTRFMMCYVPSLSSFLIGTIKTKHKKHVCEAEVLKLYLCARHGR